MRAKAFSLVEFILYFALIGIVISAIMGFAIDVIKTRSKTAVLAEVQQNARFGLQRVLQSVRQASALNVGASTLDSDNGVLSLSMLAASNTPTVFDLSGGSLRIKEGSGAATPLTTPSVSVTKLRFTKDNLDGNGTAITTELTVSWKGTNTDQAFVYVTTASSTAVIRKD